MALKDFQDLLILFNQYDVHYLVVGGHAYSVYREARATKDLDVFIEGSQENSLKVFAALCEYGAPLAGYTANDFAHEDGSWYGFGRPPWRIDVLQRIEAKPFTVAWNNREHGELFGVPVWVISKQDLIENKLAVGRPQDLVDVKNLLKYD